MVGYVGQFTNFSSKRRFMVLRQLYIVAYMIQYPVADIIVTAGKKGQASVPLTTGRVKNYGTSVKKWLASDPHRARCSEEDSI